MKTFSLNSYIITPFSLCLRFLKYLKFCCLLVLNTDLLPLLLCLKVWWDDSRIPCVWREKESESSSVVSDSLRPHGPHSPWNFPGQNTGEGSLSLLQQIFLIQESNQGLLHCRWILYQLSYIHGIYIYMVYLMVYTWYISIPCI